MKTKTTITMTHGGQFHVIQALSVMGSDVSFREAYWMDQAKFFKNNNMYSMRTKAKFHEN